jgi:uncharacterized protein YecE (DUF72 family)
MSDVPKFIVGTSGYSFADWVGVGGFYPLGTRRGEMFNHYVQRFSTVELNFTYYRMPAARTLAKLATTSPPGFTFWVKANQETTHRQNRAVAGEFIENLQPMRDAGKLAGLLLQFPQSFHRTVANRRYLAAALDDFEPLPRAVEFRHCSWAHPAAREGLRERGVTLVIPDVPEIPSLYHSPATATTPTGYLRLHSRNADLWYAGAVERYDYHYGREELAQIVRDWSDLDEPLEQVFAFFNNCHRGQAAENAEAFEKLLTKM